MRVATLNVRNTVDRWRARRGLLVRQLVALAPEVLGTQELRMVPDQARWIVAEVARVSGGRLLYQAHRRPKAGAGGLWEGIGVLSRLPVVSVAWLDLGTDARVAQRVTVRAAEGSIDVYNAHLGLGGEALRSGQARRILDWMGGRRPGPAVLLGDLNARPGSPTIELLTAGLRSAHLVAHGREPDRTVPTPLRSGAGAVLDYILVNDAVEVLDARLAFDEVQWAGPERPSERGGRPERPSERGGRPERPSERGGRPERSALCASDHYGLVADLRVRPER